MTRKITLTNKDGFFNKAIEGEVFTYSQAFIPQDVTEIAEKENITVEYCPPKTKEYLEHGCHTMKVTSIGGVKSNPSEQRQDTTTNKDVIKVLKRLVAEGYKLKAQHNNPDWRKALDDAEQLLIDEKNKTINTK